MKIGRGSTATEKSRRSTLFTEVPVNGCPVEGERQADGGAHQASRQETHVPRLGAKRGRGDTTHVCVVDPQTGMCVSLTHALGTPSGVVTDGLGFMYNGAMGAFDPRPGRSGSIAPGKARASSMAPSIVFKDGRRFFVVGAPGGTYITPGILQAILNVVDFGMSAIRRSRRRFCATSDAIWSPTESLARRSANLISRGYPVKRSRRRTISRACGIRIVDGICDGAADPGRDGMALAI